MEGLAEGGGQLVGGLQQEGMLHDGHGDTDDVGFLEAVGTDDAARNLTGDDHERNAVHVGGGDARDRVGGTRTGRDDDNTDLARGARIAISLVHRALLMAGEHVMKLLAVVKRIVNFDGLAAGITEDPIDALSLKRGHNGLRADHLRALLGRLAAQSAHLTGT